MRQLKFDNESVFLNLESVNTSAKERDLFPTRKFLEPKIVIIVIIFRKFTKEKKSDSRVCSAKQNSEKTRENQIPNVVCQTEIRMNSSHTCHIKRTRLASEPSLCFVQKLNFSRFLPFVFNFFFSV